MESANLHLHHHQLHQDHQLLVGSSSTLSTPCLSVGNNHSFPTNLLLNSTNGEDMGCHSWLNDNNNNNLSRINSESLSSLPKFTDLLSNGNLSRIQQEDDLSEKLLLKTLLLQSPNYHVGSQFGSMGSPNDVPFSANNIGATLMNSQIHPSVNISSLRNVSSGFHGISSMDMNMQPLDLFSMDRSSAETYSRLQHSLDPENVRKEKLGDRIAALQQLVAPFGKTDTASVLMEAIGYIKFLQNQVETLSVPYMKLSSHNKSNNNSMQEGSCRGGGDDDDEEPDLRSGGLCLVPLSCMNYIANDGGAGIWPPNPHNFNPGF
ncbi:hypothetical protein V2J09_011695 [Rumex salicifolius]